MEGQGLTGTGWTAKRAWAKVGLMCLARGGWSWRSRCSRFSRRQRRPSHGLRSPFTRAAPAARSWCRWQSPACWSPAWRPSSSSCRQPPWAPGQPGGTGKRRAPFSLPCQCPRRAGQPLHNPRKRGDVPCRQGAAQPFAKPYLLSAAQLAPSNCMQVPSHPEPTFSQSVSFLTGCAAAAPSAGNAAAGGAYPGGPTAGAGAAGRAAAGAGCAAAAALALLLRERLDLEAAAASASLRFMNSAAKRATCGGAAEGGWNAEEGGRGRGASPMGRRRRPAPAGMHAPRRPGAMRAVQCLGLPMRQALPPPAAVLAQGIAGRPWPCFAAGHPAWRLTPGEEPR